MRSVSKGMKRGKLKRVGGDPEGTRGREPGVEG
jgi:hypothetical protein